MSLKSVIGELKKELTVRSSSLKSVTKHELQDIAEAAEKYLHGFEGFAGVFDSKYEWSKRVIGPNRSPAGITGHIRKELLEIEANPSDLVEWIDVAMIAMDGAARFANADGETFMTALVAKHAENERREWPDWRTQEPDQPMEHVRAAEEPTHLRAEVDHREPSQAIHATLADLRVELALMKCDRDRWAERNRELESRLQRIRDAVGR